MTLMMQHHGGMATLAQMLLVAGFERSTPFTFCSDSFTARIVGPWLSLETEATRWRSPGLGRPGLWKQRKDVTLFEFPASVVDRAHDFDGEETETTGIDQLLAWCEASLVGGEPVGWTAPTEVELRAIVPADAWSIQHGPHVRQIDLVCEPNRSALHISLIASIPDDLSPARRAWLTRLLDFTNDRRRMVRLGFASAPQRTSIEAEIDLTGCPPQWYTELLPQSLAALRQIAVHLLPTLHLLCDSHVRCDAWEHSLT